MTLTEEEIKLESLKREQEELERKINSSKPGISGAVTNVSEEEIQLITQEPPKKISMGTSNYKVALLKEKLLKSPNSSLKELKKYMVDSSGIDISDDDLKNLIKEADTNKYNEIYSKLQSTLKLPNKKTAWQSTKAEKQFFDDNKQSWEDLDKMETLYITAFPNSPRNARQYVRDYLHNYRKHNSKKQNVTIKEGVITDVIKHGDVISKSEMQFFIDNQDKSFSDLSHLYHEKYINSKRTFSSICTLRGRARLESKGKSHIVEPIKHQSPTTSERPSQHILGTKVLELIRSGVSQDVLKTHKATIRELLTIPDVKQEEVKMVLEILEP